MSLPSFTYSFHDDDARLIIASELRVHAFALEKKIAPCIYRYRYRQMHVYSIVAMNSMYVFINAV